MKTKIIDLIKDKVSISKARKLRNKVDKKKVNLSEYENMGDEFDNPNFRTYKEGYQAGKQETLKRVREIIDQMGESRCGFLNENETCDRIDREKLKQKLNEKKT